MRIIILFLTFLFIVSNLSAAWKVDYTEQFSKISDYYKEIDDPPKTILIQWDMKAEYVKGDYDNNKPDSVILTIKGKRTAVILTYNKEYLSCVKNVRKKNKNVNREDLSGKCFISPWFIWFRGFSPSGNYLYFDTRWHESNESILMNTRTWEEVKVFSANTFMGWTKDRKQFVFGWIEAMWSEWWLHITIPGKFPKSQQILDDNIVWGYIDDKNIYIKSSPSFGTVSGEYYPYSLRYKVISLKTLKVIYSEKVK